MKIIITGATGFIGRALCKELCQSYEVIALSRDVNKAAEILDGTAKAVQWDARTNAGWQEYADGAFAIINLAGENVGSGHWNKSKKEQILQSRLDSVQAVLEAVKAAAVKPKVVIQASAIGFYGSRGDEELDETASQGKNFLADVCGQVESHISQIETSGVRIAIIRTGIVLGPHGGMLERLIKAFKTHMGGYFGTGKQWVSWISLADEVAAIKFLLENEGLRGAFNLASPQPIIMKEFCEILGEALNKPGKTAVPEFVARLVFGEMADEVILASQKVLPKRLLDAGFDFRYHDLKSVLVDIIGHSKSSDV